jgi:hypothetical protein
MEIEEPTKVKRTVCTTPQPKDPCIDYAGQPIGSARELNPSGIKPYPANPPPLPSPDQASARFVLPDYANLYTDRDYSSRR